MVDGVGALVAAVPPVADDPYHFNALPLLAVAVNAVAVVPAQYVMSLTDGLIISSTIIFISLVESILFSTVVRIALYFPVNFGLKNIEVSPFIT